MIHNGTTIETSGGTKYNINWCLSGMNKFEEGSWEYAYFFKIFVRLARKLSTENYEGSVFKC